MIPTSSGTLISNMERTYYKDDFLFFKEHSSADSILGDRLIVESSRIKRTIEYINSKDIKSITIDPGYFKLDNLDFLKELRSVMGIYLLKDKVDVSALNKLRNLKVLRLDEIFNEVDLMNFPGLQVLSYTYNKHILNIGACKNL